MHIATILNACCVLLQHAERIESVCRKPPARNQPRIIAMRGEEGVVEYFVICEQQVLCKQFSLPHALFFAFSAYYCFNLEYPPMSKNVLYFIQDYILDNPDSNKKSGGYLAIVSDIKRNL